MRSFLDFQPNRKHTQKGREEKGAMSQVLDMIPAK